MVKRYNPQTEGLSTEQFSFEQVERFKSNLKDLDRSLGPYPYESWKKWISLTSKISSQTVSRLEPIEGLIQSVTELLPSSQEEHAQEAQEQARCQSNEEREANLVRL